MADDSSSFQLLCTGQIESCSFETYGDLMCKYAFAYGPDWRLIEGGVDTGTSQLARESLDGTSLRVWNFPIDATFRATNAYGWPRLVISVYGLDGLGREVVRGYGSCLIPTTPGRYTRTVRAFKPASTSIMQRCMAWLSGNYPEFHDSKFVAESDGREVTRVESSGTIHVQLNVATRGMSRFGYATGAAATEPAMLGADRPGTAVSEAYGGGGYRGGGSSVLGTPGIHRISSQR